MMMTYLRYALWGGVAMAFIAFIALNLPEKRGENASASPLMSVAGFNQGKPFVLTSHDNTVYDSTKEIQNGDYALIYFGFTHCPVICPTELQKFAEIMDQLPENLSDRLHPLFITIDPERDNVAVLKDYVPLFHEKLIGLTGQTDQIHKVLDEWKIFYTKVNDPQLTDYTMDHSTYIYFVDHTMAIKGIYKMNNTSDQISQSMTKMMQ